MSERMEPLPPDVAAILAAERTAPGPSASSQERVLTRVHETLGLVVVGAGLSAGGAGGAATGGSAATATTATATTAAATTATTAATAAVATTATASTAATTTATALLLSKPIVVAIASVTVGASIYGGVKLAADDPAPPAITAPAPEREAPPAPRRERDHRTPPTAAPETAAAPAPAPVPAEAPAATPAAAPAPAVSPKPRPAAKPAPARSTLAEERALLGAARAALARGDHGGALQAVADHAKAHPSGQLSEEREALWIQALVRSGDGDAATARAAKFRKRYPRSIQLRVIDAALESL